MIHTLTNSRITTQVVRRQRRVSLFLVVVGTQLFLTIFFPTSMAQTENPCLMEIYAYTELNTCTNSNANAAARALLIADGQCRSVLPSASVSPATDLSSYNLLPGNYRAECINSTAVRILESGCITDQCNSTSLLTGATCDRNNEIAASLYSRLDVPEYLTYTNFDTSYTCTQANGSNTTVSFVIFGDCSSPTCVLPTPAPIVPIVTPTQAPIIAPTQPAPITAPTTTTTTPAPINAPTPTLIITPPSAPTASTTAAPTLLPNENPTLQPITTPVNPVPSRPSSPTMVTAPNLLPTSPPFRNDNLTVTTTAPVANVGVKSNNSSNMSTLIAGVASGVAFVAVLLALLLVYRKRKSDRGMNDNVNHHKNVMMDDGFASSSHQSPSVDRPVMIPGGNYHAGKDDSTAQQYAATTNEIWVDPNADEVSTLGGGTLPNEFAFGQDEPTASVNMDYDYNRNQYRTDIEDRTHKSQMTSPTAFTNYSKLGLLGQADFAADDDHSFEEQFAELDNDIRSTQKYDTAHVGIQNNNNSDNNPNVSNRVKPFEVRAPPGKLGMVVDTPNGGVPVVRAIKADSVLNGSVQVGDRLISVDHVNVTSMSALEVSNLISLKQHQQRLLIFCRLTPP